MADEMNTPPPAQDPGETDEELMEEDSVEEPMLVLTPEQEDVISNCQITFPTIIQHSLPLPQSQELQEPEPEPMDIDDMNNAEEVTESLDGKDVVGVGVGIDETDGPIGIIPVVVVDEAADIPPQPELSEFDEVLGNENDIEAVELIPDITLENSELKVVEEFQISQLATEAEMTVVENQDQAHEPIQIILSQECELESDLESKQCKIKESQITEPKDDEKYVKVQSLASVTATADPEILEGQATLENKSPSSSDQEETKELNIEPEKSDLDSLASKSQSPTPMTDEFNPVEPDSKSPEDQSEEFKDDEVSVNAKDDENHDHATEAELPAEEERADRKSIEDKLTEEEEAVLKQKKVSEDEKNDKKKDKDDAEDSDTPKVKKPRKVGPRKVILKKVRQIRKSKRVMKKRQLSGKDKDGHDTSFTNVMDEEHSALYLKPEILQSTKEMYNGTLYKIGDIISMVGEDGQTYYAQLKYFLGNKFCQRFVTIRWLLPNSSLPHPTQDDRVEDFHPDLYCQGPDQLEPVNMEHIRFVMHLPSIYSSGKTPFVHQEEHGLTHMNLPTTGPRIDGLGLLYSTKTSTSI